MGRISFLLYAFLMAGTMSAEESNTLYFTDAAMQPGETTNIELCMRNDGSNLSCLEAEIQLPEGISVVCDEAGSPVASLYRNRIGSHTVLGNVLSNGHLKLLISSYGSDCFSGKEGPLMSFTVRADKAMATGAYDMETVGETLLVNTSADAFYATGVKGSILLTDDPTALTGVTSSQAEGPLYNLSGQKVEKATRGVYIEGGRKKLFK